MRHANLEKTKLAHKSVAWLSGAAIVVAAVTVAIFMLNSNEEIVATQDTFEIGGEVLTVEVAETIEARALGLSDHTSLGDDEGMLFIFDEPGFYGFYMKEMDFAIDIIWMDARFEVIDLTENLTPDTYPEAVTSSEMAQYVLEVPAGFIERVGIQTGMRGILHR